MYSKSLARVLLRVQGLEFRLGEFRWQRFPVIACLESIVHRDPHLRTPALQVLVHCLISLRHLYRFHVFFPINYADVCEAGSICYLLLSDIPITNTHLGTWHGVQPDNGGLGRRVLKHLWSSGIAKPMTREVASLSNQCYLTLYGTEDDFEYPNKNTV